MKCWKMEVSFKMTSFSICSCRNLFLTISIPQWLRRWNGLCFVSVSLPAGVAWRVRREVSTRCSLCKVWYIAHTSQPFTWQTKGLVDKRACNCHQNWEPWYYHSMVTCWACSKLQLQGSLTHYKKKNNDNNPIKFKIPTKSASMRQNFTAAILC